MNLEKLAQERDTCVALRSEYIHERNAILDGHTEDKLFQVVGPFYPEMMRNTGKGALLLGRLTVHLMHLMPALIETKLKGNK